MRPRMFLALAVLALTATACLSQGNETIRMRPVTAQKLAGIVSVKGDNAQPISGAHVEDCDAEWQHVLVSTTTDMNGHFQLTPVGKGPLHYLRVYATNFDVSQYPVKLSKFAPSELHFEIHVGT